MKTTFGTIALLGAISLATPPSAPANDGGVARALWRGAAAATMNVVPVTSIFASQRCLPGYLACKLMFAGMGIAASGVQVLAGGDLDGARRTMERAFGGDWIVLPRHVGGDVKPDPYPEASRDDSEFDLPEF